VSLLITPDAQCEWLVVVTPDDVHGAIPATMFNHDCCGQSIPRKQQAQLSIFKLTTAAFGDLSARSVQPTQNMLRRQICDVQQSVRMNGDNPPPTIVRTQRRACGAAASGCSVAV
jgi:hypothetical protein